MRRFALLLFAFVAVVPFTGCVGHVGNSLPAVGGANAPRSYLPVLPRFTRAFLGSAPRVAWRSSGAWRLPPASMLMRTLLRAIAEHGSSSFSRAQRTSSAGSGDSESVGVVVNPGGPYTGIVGFQTAYTPFSVPQTGTSPQIQIGYPPGATGSSALVAPLLLPSNGSCLAPAVLYVGFGASTAALFVALDFCGGGYDFAKVIDDSPAVRQYVGIVNGRPGFYTATLTPDKQPTPASTWYLMIYNFALSHFDLAASKVGLSSNTSGLGVFLGKFVAGRCPITPPLAASGLQLYNATTGTFQTLVPTMTGTTSVVLPVGSGDSCFHDDVTGPASFTFSMLNPNAFWQVNPQVPTTSISEFSSGITPASGLEHITSGPDGNLWFAEADRARIGRITPSGTVTEFSTGITAGGQPWGVTAGPDGNLWFTEASGNRIGRITPSGAVTEFSNGISYFSTPEAITTGPDGNLWFTETNANRIGRITPTGNVKEFSSGISSGPYDIAAGPDGNLWFTERIGKIGRITPSGAVTEFSSGISADPFGIAAGPDGRLWFTEENGNLIGSITTTGTVTEFSSGITANSGPWSIASGPDGNLWFTEAGGNGSRIGRITTAGAITEFSNGISPNSAPVSITTGPDSNLWFTEAAYTNGNRVGQVVP